MATAVPCSVARLQHRLRRALVATQLGAALALVALGWAGRGGGAPGSRRPAALDRFGVFLLLVALATLVAAAWCPRPGCCTGRKPRP
jgi:hypothetical protein